MLFETHTIAAAANSGPGSLVCGPPTISSSMRRAVDHRDWAISTVTRAIEKPRSTDERSEILPGSPTMSTTSRAPSRIGSSQRGPSRSSLGSKSVKSIALRTAPAMCQRASPTTGSGPTGSIPRSLEPSFGGPVALV